MPSELDKPLVKYGIVPVSALGFTLTILALALAIAQAAIQLQNNSGISIAQKSNYDSNSHTDPPVITICGPKPFDIPQTQCIQYQSGLRPVSRNYDGKIPAESGNESIAKHVQQFGLSPCISTPASESILWQSFTLSNSTYYCGSFSKALLPTSLQNGVATRIFFQLAWQSTRDFEQYVIRLWNPTELRTPQQAALQLVYNPESLFGGSGSVLTIPYSLPGTMLFQAYTPPFVGPTYSDVSAYGAPGDPSVYGPVSVRGGVSAVIQLTESGFQYLTQSQVTYSFLMNIIDLSPEIEYPYLDTSYFFTIAFLWNSDVVFVEQETIILTKVGMASLIIVTIAGFCMAAMGRSFADLYLTVKPEKR